MQLAVKRAHRGGKQAEPDESEPPHERDGAGVVGVDDRRDMRESALCRGIDQPSHHHGAESLALVVAGDVVAQFGDAVVSGPLMEFRKRAEPHDGAFGTFDDDDRILGTWLMGVDPRTTAFQRHRFKVGGRSPTDHRLVVDVGDGRNVGVNGRADGIGHVFKHNNRPAGGIGRGRLGSAVHNARFASIRRQERGQRPHNREARELSRPSDRTRSMDIGRAVCRQRRQRNGRSVTRRCRSRRPPRCHR